MQVDKSNDDKGIMAFAPVAGVAALALLAIPLLPILFAANPDQLDEDGDVEAPVPGAPPTKKKKRSR